MRTKTAPGPGRLGRELTADTLRLTLALADPGPGLATGCSGLLAAHRGIFFSVW